MSEFQHNPKDIKYHVAKYLQSIQENLKDKVVIDAPAGTGITSDLLAQYGAQVMAFDLFPEYFKSKTVHCKRADITQGIPVAADTADMLICQEGMEHFSDQLKVMKECNRVLKTGGLLVITTPSASNLAAKLSYLLFESESSHQMPPNEIHDIWMADESLTQEIYYGHIFLIGLQKLRILGRLSGFRIKEIRYVRLSRGSLLLFPLCYPFILIRSLLTYTRNLKKYPTIDMAMKKAVFKEQLLLNINPKHLLNKHTFMVLEKESSVDKVNFRHAEALKPFDENT